MAAGMMSNQMASEIIHAMGGRVTKARLRAFQRFCDALVRHVQNNMVVTSQGTDPQGGIVVSTSIKVQ